MPENDEPGYTPAGVGVRRAASVVPDRRSAEVGEDNPSRVIATDGTWAFDHDGWTLEADLLAATAAYESEIRWELLPITTDLAGFCAAH